MVAGLNTAQVLFIGHINLLACLPWRTSPVTQMENAAIPGIAENSRGRAGYPVEEMKG
jgi:hypothetical protein